MKHTKGPWHYSGDGLTHRSYQIYSPYGGVGGRQTHICTTNDLPHSLLVSRDLEEANANARLIAAAPELLSFAKHVLEQINSGACGYIDGTEAELKSYAEQLIAKAEGSK